jgi:hypothetical protein
MERDGSLDELALTLSEAYYLARQGRVARGYLILLAGFDEARQSRAEGAERLVELWRRVLAQFQEQFPREWYRELS